MDTVIAVIVILIAAFFVGRKIYRQATAKGGCGGGCGCSGGSGGKAEDSSGSCGGSCSCDKET
ncbi:FeoB-associated Cys-rich membrane protein [Desulfovibrio sp. Huiquan2017]|uniref:FeoB-associated Cys-rich membrane protein n=1 Tax=Desulfovibrio sp. Huiquan2017 TaxID=2816861 RepID=UPI001A91C0D5|nr:FeoB-associated Cys-rich membrane protein [Desulfovibrio sp. Huiquan2017]